MGLPRMDLKTGNLIVRWPGHVRDRGPSPRLLTARQERLRARMEEHSLPILLVTSLANIFYLTGFRGSAGAALVGRSELVLFVDPRYTLQAREEAGGVEVIEAKRGLLLAVAAWLRKRDARRVGYEAAHLACAGFERLMSETRPRVRFQPGGGLIEELRVVKDEEEIAKIRSAGRLTVEVYEEVLEQVRPGARESDLAAEIEYRMRKKGAQGAAFETIVASGARGAFPHARASCKLLEKDDLVILDLGAILCGYAADMTRTVSLGEPGRRVRSLYNAVAGAQQRAVEALREGTRAGGRGRRCATLPGGSWRGQVFHPQHRPWRGLGNPRSPPVGTRREGPVAGGLCGDRRAGSLFGRPGWDSA